MADNGRFGTGHRLYVCNTGNKVLTEFHSPNPFAISRYTKVHIFTCTVFSTHTYNINMIPTTVPDFHAIPKKTIMFTSVKRLQYAYSMPSQESAYLFKRTISTPFYGSVLLLTKDRIKVEHAYNSTSSFLLALFLTF